jgi:hypothetical protein
MVTRDQILSEGLRSRLRELLIQRPTRQTNLTDRQVFFCHSSPDKALVKTLGNDLARLGVSPWIDDWEIGLGDSLFSKVASGISQAAFFCIVLSKASVISNWCTMELEQALTQQLLNKTRIIPFKIEDVEVPPFLGASHYLDLKRGQNHETFRLAAKLYGISERAVDTFLREFPDPSLEASIGFFELAVKDHDIHFGERDWQRLQEILLKQGIEPSER